MYDIIIIGAGPAGLTSAIYALRANKKVLVLEGTSYGGQIVNADKIENYPGIKEISGYDLATSMYEQVKNLNGEIKFERVIKIDKDKNVYTANNTYSAKNIIIATGMKNRKLNLENEDNLIGKGISYCATCDGNFYRNKTVMVNGGGSVALEDALYLSNICSKVYLVHRKDTFKGEAKYLEELEKKENVEIILNSTITKLNRLEKLESVILNNDKEVKVDGLFIAIGKEPNNEIFSDLIDLDEKGFIKSIDGVHTNIEGIYVAGDIREKNIRQLTTAVSDGTIATTTILREMR